MRSIYFQLQGGLTMESRGEATQVWDLSKVPAGEWVRIKDLGGGHELLSRLASMGFTPGARLRVIQNRGRGPLLVGLRDTRVALGRGEAGQISVERAAEAG